MNEAAKTDKLMAIIAAIHRILLDTLVKKVLAIAVPTFTIRIVMVNRIDREVL